MSNIVHLGLSDGLSASDGLGLGHIVGNSRAGIAPVVTAAATGLEGSGTGTGDEESEREELHVA